MSKEFKALVDAGEDLQYALRKFLDKYKEAEDNTARNLLSAEEHYQFVMLYQAQDKIGDAYSLLEKMFKKERAEGVLEKFPNGRYSVDGRELSSGTYVEYWVEDEDGGCYMPSRVEHNGDDYYIVALGRDKAIEGMRVRLK